MDVSPTASCYHQPSKTNLTAAPTTLLLDTMPTDYIFTFHLQQTHGWSYGLTKCQQSLRRYQSMSGNVSFEQTVASIGSESSAVSKNDSPPHQ